MVVRMSWERAFAGPMTKPLPFTEARVRRVIAAARKEGIATGAISIHPDGTITVRWGEQGVALSAPPPHNAASSEWEDIQV
jgi:hypothetical protein